jgi:DNA polymerase III subunit beta
MITLRTTVAAFLPPFAQAAMVAERRSPVPVLRMVRLRLGGGAALLEATDMERGMLAAVPGAESGGVGRCLLHPEVLGPMLRAAQPEDAVEITASGEDHAEVSVSVGVLRWRAEMRMGKELPPLPVADNAVAAFHVEARDLLGIIQRCWHAISREETRYYLNGIYLHAAGGALRGIATDGHRMMWHDIEAPEGMPDDLGVIVPTHAWAVLRDLLAEHDGLVKVIIGPRPDRGAQVVEFCAGDWTLATKTIDGTYPDYGRAVPQPGDATASVSVRSPAAFAAYVMALIGGGERSKQVVLRPGLGGGVSVLSGAANDDNGRTSAALPADVAGFEGMVAEDGGGFQARYLRDIAEALPEGFTLRMPGHTDPTLIEAEGSAVGVIMPMKVAGLVDGA